jgi:CRP-like cAMP-binding protein
MSNTDQPLAKLVDKLASRNAVTSEDVAAVLALPHAIRTYGPHAYLIRQDAPANRYTSFLLSGYAFGHKLTAQGARQILSLHLPGDFIDLSSLFMAQTDHNAQALTGLEILEIESAPLQASAAERPAVARALWVDTLVAACVAREWIVNVGRRDARTRIAHLLCEFVTRMKIAGLDRGSLYELPMTQEQIGDATGLTSVHVNRTLKLLTENGLVLRSRGYLSFTNWERLIPVADFNPSYLHLGQVEQQAPRPSVAVRPSLIMAEAPSAAITLPHARSMQ